MSAMEYEAEQRPYDDEASGYRDRSRSPRGDRDNGPDVRTRSASPNDRGRTGSRPPLSAVPNLDEDDEMARNEGSNLFVTGIHPRINEEELTALFEKYGEVETCNIMRDPHTKDSRGFGFVKMATRDSADKAKDGLAGEVIEGRTLSIEKARRSKPRTPTPGKYFGPPKRGNYDPSAFSRHDSRSRGRGRGRGNGRGGFPARPPTEFYVVGKHADIYWGEDFRPRGGRFGGGGGGGDRYSRYDDRGYGSSRRDDHGYRGGSRYGDRYGDRYDDRYDDRYEDRHRYEDRGYSGSRRDRDEGFSRGGGDRYGSSDRYSRDDRRGGGYSGGGSGGGGGGGSGGAGAGGAGFERDDARGSGAGYENREPYTAGGGGASGGGSRSYDDRGEDRYSGSRR